MLLQIFRLVGIACIAPSDNQQSGVNLLFLTVHFQFWQDRRVDNQPLKRRVPFISFQKLDCINTQFLSGLRLALFSGKSRNQMSTLPNPHHANTFPNYIFMRPDSVIECLQ